MRNSLAFKLACYLVLLLIGFVNASSIGQSAYQVIQDEGSNLTRQSVLNFAGAGVTCANGSGKTTCTIPGGAGGFYQTIQQAGSPLPQEPVLNFAANMTCTDNAGVSTDCTPSGGGGGGVTISGLRFSGDSGTTWYGPILQLFEPPSVASFTAINAGSSTATKTNGTIFFTTPAATGTNIRAYVETMPSRPFSLKAIFNCPMAEVFGQCGIVLRESGTGKMAVYSILCCVNDQLRIIIQLYTDATTYASFEVFGATGKAYVAGGQNIALRWDLEAGSGNRIPFWSANGTDWIQAGGTPVAWDSFLTPDQIGFAIESQGSGIPNTGMTLLSYTR